MKNNRYLTIICTLGIIFSTIFNAFATEPLVFISDVSPFSFMVNIRSLLSMDTIDINVFSDEQANNNISHQLIKHLYPLRGHSEENHAAWSIKNEKEMLRNYVQEKGILQVYISGCLPSTTYYFTIPSDSTVYSVITADQNSFLDHAPQLIVQFPTPNLSYQPKGNLVIAKYSGAKYPVSAIVGDGMADNAALINLSNFFDHDGMNINPMKTMDISVMAQGKHLTPVYGTLTIDNSDHFEIAHLHSLFINSPPTVYPVSIQHFFEGNQYTFDIQANDIETENGNLLISAHSSNLTLIPDQNIQVYFTGTDYSVSITPVSYQSGSASVTLTVSDGYSQIHSIVEVDITAVADDPIITIDSPLHGIEDIPLQLPLDIQLVDQDGSELLENICFSGVPEGAVLTPSVYNGICWAVDNDDVKELIYIPKPNDHSDTELTISCQSREKANNDVAQTTKAINIQLLSVNDPPSISQLVDIVIDENTTSSPIAFTITDVDHSSEELQVSVSSDNLQLFPNASLILSGTDKNRYLTLTPTPHYSGDSQITLKVSDGSLTDETHFMVTVRKYIPELLGDFDGNGNISLNDLIIALQVMTQIEPVICYPTASLNSTNINVDDAIYIIFKLAEIVFHSGDYNPGDLQINIYEMLRVIQLYNSGVYHCDTISEDGYAPGASEENHECSFHSADYAHDDIMPDWTIDDQELERFIELYNADYYVPDPQSEDGYRPVKYTHPLNQ